MIDREKVTRRNAISAVARVQQNSTERQQNVTGNAAVDTCVGSPSDSGTDSVYSRIVKDMFQSLNAWDRLQTQVQ